MGFLKLTFNILVKMSNMAAYNQRKNLEANKIYNKTKVTAQSNIKVKRCPKCNLTLNKNAKECGRCGHKFLFTNHSKKTKKTVPQSYNHDMEIKRCPKCNLTLNINAKKCARCGYSFRL